MFRFAGLGYAVLLTAVIDRGDYFRLDWAWAVIGVMTAWTVATTMAYARPERRTRLLLSTDLAVTAGLLLSTAALQYPAAMRHGVMPVTGIWVAGPVLAWAVRYGRRAGAIAALIISGCDFLLRSEAITVVLNGVVLLLLAGVVVGHLARLAAEVETERQHAVEVEAASRERERLARDIHDSVLQVLAMVQRRGAEAGGAAAELGRLAGQQEAALRSLVASVPVGGGPAASPSGDVDLRALVLPVQSDQVTVFGAGPVRSAGKRGGRRAGRGDPYGAGQRTAALRGTGPGLDPGRRRAGPGHGDGQGRRPGHRGGPAGRGGGRRAARGQPFHLRPAA